MSSRFKACLALARPHNAAIGGISIFIGALLSGSLEPLSPLLLAVLSGMFIAAGANSINDYYDYDIDSVNKPERPIPSGMISRYTVRLLALVWYAAGFALGVMVGSAAASIAAIAVAGTYAYSARLKRLPVLGNLTVAFISALAFIYGGVAVGRAREAVIPALFAFLFHLGREVIKDMEDAAGDRSAGAKTLPIRFGRRPALIFMTASFVFLAGLTFLPFILKVYGILYFIVVVTGVDFVLGYVILSAWSDSGQKNLSRLSRILKIDMLVGLLALYLGTL